MSKYEEIKKAIMLMNGVSDVHYDYSSKTNCYYLHFMKDDRYFYLLSSSNNDCHFYCNYLSEDYWVVNYSHYTAKDVIEILEKLFFLLPQYDTDKMIDEMRAFADAINLDYKYADDDDQYEKLASILAEKYINSHHLKNDEYNVLYTVIEHVGINAIYRFSIFDESFKIVVAPTRNVNKDPLLYYDDIYAASWIINSYYQHLDCRTTLRAIFKLCFLFENIKQKSFLNAWQQ